MLQLYTNNDDNYRLPRRCSRFQSLSIEEDEENEGVERLSPSTCLPSYSRISKHWSCGGTLLFHGYHFGERREIGERRQEKGDRRKESGEELKSRRKESGRRQEKVRVIIALQIKG